MLLRRFQHIAIWCQITMKFGIHDYYWFYVVLRLSMLGAWRQEDIQRKWIFELETGPTYLLISELLVIAESRIVPSSIPTGLLHSKIQAEHINLTNFLNYYGLCHAATQKWINILKGTVTAPLGKRPERDKKSFNTISCKSATKLLVKSKFEGWKKPI